MTFLLQDAYVPSSILYFSNLFSSSLCFILITADEHTVTDGEVTYTYGVKADVGLLTRNIKIEGGEYDDLIEESFGSRLIVGRFFQDGEMYLGN